MIYISIIKAVVHFYAWNSYHIRESWASRSLSGVTSFGKSSKLVIFYMNIVVPNSLLLLF